MVSKRTARVIPIDIFIGMRIRGKGMWLVDVILRIAASFVGK
jgi:hypothetical protein